MPRQNPDQQRDKGTPVYAPKHFQLQSWKADMGKTLAIEYFPPYDSVGCTKTMIFTKPKLCDELLAKMDHNDTLDPLPDDKF